MIKRSINLSKTNSFFLFGARGTGKSTFIKEQFLTQNSVWTLDLLDPEVEDLYSRNPMQLARELRALQSKPEWVFIDEVQKVPRLLDVVHKLIEEEAQKFILTGSSSRKLRRGAANLLAGRAFVYSLFPLTAFELKEKFSEDFYFRWGGLPKIYSFESDSDRKTYLRSYALTYLKEEIKAEQFVRHLDPFRHFLEIAAQMSNQIINYTKIARNLGIDHKTVKSYFDILVDTWIGFYLPGFDRSIRKSQLKSPKFYFFDIGIRKCLAQNTGSFSNAGSSSFGEDFEQFLITEVFRWNEYTQADWRMSFVRTKNDLEIDLILSKGQRHLACEFKSSHQVDEHEVQRFEKIAQEIPGSTQLFFVSRDSRSQQLNSVRCLHWKKFLEEIFTLTPGESQSPSPNGDPLQELLSNQN